MAFKKVLSFGQGRRHFECLMESKHFKILNKIFFLIDNGALFKQNQ